MNFQKSGSFQVTYLASEFYDVFGSGANKIFSNKFASRPIKLAGRFKVTLTGFFITSAGNTAAFNTYEIAKYGWAFVINCQQFSSPLTAECAGPVIHLAEQAQTYLATSADYYRLAFQGGNPMEDLSFNAYFQDRIDINIAGGYDRDSTTGLFNFNKTFAQAFSVFSAGAYGTPFDATITLTFKFEAV